MLSCASVHMSPVRGGEYGTSALRPRARLVRKKGENRRCHNLLHQSLFPVKNAAGVTLSNSKVSLSLLLGESGVVHGCNCEARAAPAPSANQLSRGGVLTGLLLYQDQRALLHSALPHFRQALPWKWFCAHIVIFSAGKPLPIAL